MIKKQNGENNGEYPDRESDEERDGNHPDRNSGEQHGSRP